MACLAKEFKMLSKKEVCDLTDRGFQIAFDKLSPDQNVGCVSEAKVKSATINGYRGECKRPIRSNDQPLKSASPSKTKKSPLKLSPRSVKATDQYAAFKKRNQVDTRRDIYDNVWTKGIKNPTLNILDDIKTSATGLLNTGYGLGKIPVDFAVGTYHGLHGVGHGVRGVARLAKQTFRLGLHSWARMRYHQKKNDLLNCTTNCQSLEDDCCTPEKIQSIKADIDKRYAEIKQEETAKRDYLLQEAQNYAKEMHGEEATTFLKLAAQQIENEFTKSMQELADKKGGRRSRRRRR